MKRSRKSRSPCVFGLAITIAVLIALLAMPTVLYAQASPQDDDHGVRIVPRNEQYAGLTYPEWEVKYWQWNTLLPTTHHPLFDTTDCSAGQVGPVWFIDGKFCTLGQACNGEGVKRTCKIPAGKALFVSIAVAEDSFIEEPVGKTEADLRAWCKSVIDLVTNIVVMIDGRPVQHPEKYRLCNSGPTCTPLQSPLYTYTLAPTDNVWAAGGTYLHGDPNQGLMPDGLTSEAAADGYVVLVEPLSPGWHTIFFSGELPAYGLKFDDTYYIKVVK